MTEPTVRDKNSAERALDRWGGWRGFRGSQQLRDAMAEAIRDERERCARIAEADGATMVGRRIAAAIRGGAA
jgi:hypothetical protein